MMKELSVFCRRVGISVNAGLSLVQAVKREGIRKKYGKIWLEVARSMEDGNSLTDSLRPYQKLFGEMFVGLIEAGELSGRLGETLVELADYYDEMLKVKHDFKKSLVLPVIELCAALLIIGLIILLLGFIKELTGQTIDLLGFGLIGVKGFIKYVCILAVIGSIGTCLYFWTKKSIQRFRPVHYCLDKIPKIGRLCRTLALMKLTWGLHMTMRTGMEVKHALSLSFRGTAYAPVVDDLPAVLDQIERGGSLTDAFLAAKHLDGDLLTSIDSGEHSGSVPELMAKMSTMYLQESLLNLKVVTVIGGFVVYGCIATFIIFVIFRIASFYIGAINSAL